MEAIEFAFPQELQPLTRCLILMNADDPRELLHRRKMEPTPQLLTRLIAEARIEEAVFDFISGLHSVPKLIVPVDAADPVQTLSDFLRSLEAKRGF